MIVLAPSNTSPSNPISSTASPIGKWLKVVCLRTQIDSSHFCLVTPYNRPRLDRNASWSANATTFANATLVGSNPCAVFISTNNTIYATDKTNRRVQIWVNESLYSTRTVAGNGSSLMPIFVTSVGDIYIDGGNPNARVERWIANTNTSVPVMNAASACYGLFVDIGETLYCSMYHADQVISTSLTSNMNITTIVAGTGCQGSTANTLHSPYGIFVDDFNLDLYVADENNHRIQRFGVGQLDGVTVAGNRSTTVTITLLFPSSIVLDADTYLFIVDSNNHRVVGSGPHGFRCLFGCSQQSGSASNQLNDPTVLAFDQHGNLFVADGWNNRIQKLLLITNSGTTTLDRTTATTHSDTSSSLDEHHTSQTTTAPTSTSDQPKTSLPPSTTIVPACRSPTITLVPGPSTLSVPLQFRRSDDFSIVSIIELNCKNSSSITTDWTIKNCTSSSSCLNPIHVDATIATTFSELFIRARTLPYGLYQMTLTVNTVGMSSLSSTSSVHVRISASDIQPHLIEHGTSMITRGFQQDLTLDPGSYSLDPDEESFDATVCRSCPLSRPSSSFSLVEVEIQVLLSNTRSVSLSDLGEFSLDSR